MAMNVFSAAGRQALLRRLRRVTRDNDQAEDLLQAAYVRLAEASRRNVVVNEAGFLVHTASNLAIDGARRARTRAEVANGMDRLVELSDGQPLQDEVLLARERLSRVRSALARLPGRTRDVFLMHRFAKLKYRDIAARLGISVSAVEKHIAKATLHLADWMDDEQDGPRRRDIGKARK
jgi:RNA polymerase sigma-70 factor (ECF subfamily)